MADAKKKNVRVNDLDVSGRIRVGNREWVLPEEKPGLTLADVEELVHRVDAEWTEAVAGVREDLVGLSDAGIRVGERVEEVADRLAHLDVREAQYRPTYFQQQGGEVVVGPGDRTVLDWARVADFGAGVVDRELHVIPEGLYEVRVEVTLSTTGPVVGALIAERLDNRKVEEAQPVGTLLLSQNKGLPERYAMTTLARLDATHHLRLVVQNSHDVSAMSVHGDPDLSFMSVRLVEPAEE